MDKVVCPRCGKENDSENRFCSRCGINLSEVHEQQLSQDAVPCPRHPKEMTVLRCGRCDTVVCHRCVVIGPAGPRCPDCAKQNIQFRPAAVLLSLKLGLRRFLSSGPMTIYFTIILVLMIFGAVRSCMPSKKTQVIEYVPVESKEE